MPNVNFVRPEVSTALDSWQLIQDCLDGQKAIKSKRTNYLPMPNAADQSPENIARYDAYLARAVFYNVTARTLRGLIGQVFARDSEITIPDNLKMLEEDTEGTGVSIDQQSKRALESVLSCGRAGILADYPVTGGEVTKAEQDSGKIRPLLKLYKPWDIVNWRTQLFGAQTKLALVVLREQFDDEDDGFEVKTKEQYRVLRLDENENYTVTIYRSVSGDKNASAFIETDAKTITPKDHKGQPFKEIPFTFIGSENNDSELDPSPLLDLAVINVAHYRNSADYEDSCFMVGQPTPWASGLTKEWAKDVLNNTIQLGSRAFLPLPVNAQAGLLQATENTMVFEAMQHKERQMVALGAKLVEDKSVQRTATEATQEEAAESSSLSSAVKNVSAAYTRALRWAARFIGEFKDEDVELCLNSDFDISRMTAEERAQLIKEWQADAISWTEMRHSLKMGGVAFQDDDEAKDEIETTPALKVDPNVQATLEARAAMSDNTPVATA